MPTRMCLAAALLLATSGCVTPTDPTDLDADADGFLASPGGSDCDDARDDVFPDAPESCEAVDHDCNGVIASPNPTDATEWYADADGDGRLNGADSGELEGVDIPIVRPVGESYTTKDVQLDTAVAELLKQIGSAPARITSGK